MAKADLTELTGKIETIAGMLMTQTAILERVEAQTMKTNGRVTELEHWRERIDAVAGERKEKTDSFLDRYHGPILSAVISGLFFLAISYLIPRP